ncbi:hypothetical protein B0I26_102292 [Anoxybacillus vitaminiphilus]|uniref:Uncharacterized protein n=1 Tax=Paranoxybacillus vitaminiphilus TaxID=581036 RepID=A0A327YN23_9BACL|nr:hypothetical protein [Anoxybacillus vitaminiphilus]RAK22300.1 hypothetical protein B0I26_102292 [Anoxybacillus vitaminiphilus]
MERVKQSMIEFIKGIIENINQMIVALVEFDYEKAYEEMNKKK